MVHAVQPPAHVETTIDLRSHLTSCLQILLQRYRDELARTARELAPKIEEIVEALRALDDCDPADVRAKHGNLFE